MTGPLMVDDYELDLIIQSLDDRGAATIKLLEATNNDIVKRLLRTEHDTISDLIVRLRNQQADEAADWVNRTMGHEIPKNKDPF